MLIRVYVKRRAMGPDPQLSSFPVPYWAWRHCLLLPWCIALAVRNMLRAFGQCRSYADATLLSNWCRSEFVFPKGRQTAVHTSFSLLLMTSLVAEA